MLKRSIIILNGSGKATLISVIQKNKFDHESVEDAILYAGFSLNNVNWEVITDIQMRSNQLGVN